MKKSLLFVAGLSLAVLIGFVIMPIVNQATRAVVTAVKVKGEIIRGTKLTEDDIYELEIGSYGAPEDLITDKEDVIGKYASVTIYPDDVITASKLAINFSEDEALLQIDRGYCAVSVSVPSLAAGFSGRLCRNDVVSVYCVRDSDANESGKVVSLDALLQYMLVIGISNSKATDADATYTAPGSTTIASTVTFRCTPNQAAKLIEMEATGEIHLSFIGRGEQAHAMLNAFNASLVNPPSEQGGA